MRLAIVTGVWRRPEVFEMFAAGIKMLQDHFRGRLEIVCTVAGSEGFTSQLMVQKHKDFFYVETPNAYLGRKMNKAVECARRLCPDYCLLVGSDDIIGVSLMEQYFLHMTKGIELTVLMDCYFFDTTSKRGLYWGGYIEKFNKGMSLGMGKLISARLMGLMRWNPWPEGYDRILDTGIDRHMKGIAIKSKKELHLRTDGLFALDIKSSTNMTKFDLWPNASYVDGKQLLYNNLPADVADLIYGK